MSFWMRNWFLLSLVLVMAAGIFLSVPLKTASQQQWLSDLIVMLTMFLVALPLETTQIQRACRHPMPALLATFVSFVLLPVAAWMCLPWLPTQFAAGLMICAVVPGTLASAAVWTRRAGGNEMVPILVTVLTNLSCFLIIPAWLQLALGHADIPISGWEMTRKLALLVVLPMILGQLVRGLHGVASWANGRRPLLGTMAQMGILSIVLVGAVQCGNYLREVDLSARLSVIELSGMAVLLLGLNLYAFAVGKYLALWLRMPHEDAIGVAFAGSQKTLMVGLHVALLLGGGIYMLPMVIYHFLQLFLGTLLADQHRRASRDLPPSGVPRHPSS